MRISDWSSDVCSSDLRKLVEIDRAVAAAVGCIAAVEGRVREEGAKPAQRDFRRVALFAVRRRAGDRLDRLTDRQRGKVADVVGRQRVDDRGFLALGVDRILDRLANPGDRSEEHTSELQSLMRISYAVFCLKKKKHKRRLKND